MSEAARLRELLREVPVPGAEEAERRGRGLVEAAYAERLGGERAPSRRPALPRLALALAIATLLLALLLSPAGAAVRNWVDDVFTASTPRAEPGLTEIPGGGRLLVQGPAGPWVVQPDGSRRLLGRYDAASWSPRGLFVVVAAGRTLSAIEPGGTPHWSLTAPAAISDPRWSTSCCRIAYRSGAELRVVAGDGTGDRLIAASTAPVAPSWSPLGLLQLAFVDGRGDLRIAETESGRTAGRAPALADVEELEWGDRGSLLLEASAAALRLRRIEVAKLASRLRLGPGRRLPLPTGSTLRDAALSPRGATAAAVVSHASATGRRSAVLLFSGHGGPARRLLDVPGDLGELAWSPDARRLLVAWPDADQWLFLPVGRGRGRSIAGVAAAFDPGRRAASFPRLEGWCCPPSPGGG